MRFAEERMDLFPPVMRISPVVVIEPVPSTDAFVPDKVSVPVPEYVPFTVKFPVTSIAKPPSDKLPKARIVRMELVVFEPSDTVWELSIITDELANGTHEQFHVDELSQFPD